MLIQTKKEDPRKGFCPLRGSSYREVPDELLSVVTGNQRVFVALDHFLNHLTADRACLTGGEVTVVAVLVEGNAYLVSCFHFELLQCLLCAGNKGLVACHSILLFLLVHCALISAAHILIGGVTNLHMIYIIEPESTDVLSGDRCFSFELCYYCEQSEGKYEWEIVTEKRIVLSNNKEDKLLFSGGRENLLRRRRCATSTECKPCFG